MVVVQVDYLVERVKNKWLIQLEGDQTALKMAQWPNLEMLQSMANLIRPSLPTNLGHLQPPPMVASGSCLIQTC